MLEWVVGRGGWHTFRGRGVSLELMDVESEVGAGFADVRGWMLVMLG